MSRRAIGIPKRHFSTILLAAGGLLLAGIRFSHQWQGWMLAASGALLAGWCWQYHRDRAWIVRLNLLLGQHIGIQFSDLQDLESFTAALQVEKGGDLPVVRR